MNKVSGIYIIVNNKNGKFYLGQSQNLQRRCIDHRYELNHNKHNNKHLQAAWVKYGSVSFEFHVLEYCSIDNLDMCEQRYLDACVPSPNCYNISQCATAPTRGLVFNAETRMKLSKASKGRKHSAESIERMRHMQSNRTDEHRANTSIGQKNKKPISDETRKKLSESHKGQIPSAETIQKRSIALRGRTGHTPSEKTLEAIKKANTGRVHSAEEKLKRSESLKESHRLRRLAKGNTDE